MEGLEISEVNISELEFSGRLDSEYYRKIFLNYEQQIRNKSYLKLGDICNFLIGPFGSAFKTENYEDNSGYRYVRGQDVKPFILQDDDIKFMPKDDFIRLSKYALKKNDILVSVVGTIGNASIVETKDVPAIFSCKSTVIRPFDINPMFLMAYLNSKYGCQLMIRKERGAIQKGLNLDDLKDVEISILSIHFQKQIEILIILALKKIYQSKDLFSTAEKLLLSELDLSNWKPKIELTTEKSFSDFLSSGRLDAEYYQPKYDELIENLNKFKTKKLGNIVEITKSIEPGSGAYMDKGIPFIRVSNLSRFGLSTPDIYLDSDEYEGVIKPHKDTILLSKDGSVGIAYKVQEDINAITSGAILHLNITDEEFLPDYLTLVLNSVIVKMQAERDAGGSIIQHWKPSEIADVIIPKIDKKSQEEIVTKIQESFALRAESKRLLELVKKAVEVAIEQGEEKALELLNKKVE